MNGVKPLSDETRRVERIGRALSSIISRTAAADRTRREMCAPDACEVAAKLGIRGHYASVTFAPMKGDPQRVRLYSSNWKCEDEVNGIYTAREARELYRKMVAAGAEVLAGKEVK